MGTGRERAPLGSFYKNKTVHIKTFATFFKQVKYFSIFENNRLCRKLLTSIWQGMILPGDYMLQPQCAHIKAWQEWTVIFLKENAISLDPGPQTDPTYELPVFSYEIE